MIASQHTEPASAAFSAEFADGRRLAPKDGPSSFTIVIADPRRLDRLLKANAYSAALGFIRGDYDIRGDLVAAVRFKRATAGRGLKSRLATLAAGFAPRRIERLFQTRSRAARNIQFHYDRSNEFYRLFLDARMQYSEAYYRDPSQTLEQAQEAKLDHICRKLGIAPGNRFLDIGCGWAGLAIFAAERYGAKATGCTVSHEQFEYAQSEVAARGLAGRVQILLKDYRDIEGEFDSIASVGMYEHVGRSRLRGYFEKVASLLSPAGLFLNSGIVRPETAGDDPETLFLQRQVFPGGELPHLSEVIRKAGEAGFEVVDVENVRLHYGMTCRDWVERLERNKEACLRLVDARTWRTWLLYLAASALSFEEGQTGAQHVLMRKQGPGRPWRVRP